MSCQGGSWSRSRLSMPNENLMLIGRDCHRAPLQGFKIRPTSSQCQDPWSPKSKAWRGISAFLGTWTERKSVRERGKSKQDLNWHGIVALLPDQQNSFQGLILHAVPYPHKSYKIQRLAHGSGISSERKITLSSGIRCNSVARKGDREVGNILSRDTAEMEELGKGDGSLLNLGGKHALWVPVA